MFVKCNVFPKFVSSEWTTFYTSSWFWLRLRLTFPVFSTFLFFGARQMHLPKLPMPTLFVDYVSTALFLKRAWNQTANSKWLSGTPLKVAQKRYVGHNFSFQLPLLKQGINIHAHAYQPHPPLPILLIYKRWIVQLALPFECTYMPYGTLLSGDAGKGGGWQGPG